MSRREASRPAEAPLPAGYGKVSEPPMTGGQGGLTCPFCGSAETELVSLFGSQLLVDQHRCRACRSYFEAVRDDR